MSIDIEVWIGRDEAAQMVGCTVKALYMYGKRGMLETCVTGQRRFYWVESVKLLAQMVREVGGMRVWRTKMRRDGWRLRAEPDAQPFWWARVQALKAGGVPQLAEPEPTTAVDRIRPEGIYTRRASAKLLGCSPSTIKRLIEEGQLDEVQRGRLVYVTGDSLARLAREVVAAGGYARRVEAMQEQVTRRAAVCRVCEVLLAAPDVPQGEGDLCGWCVAEVADTAVEVAV